MITMRSDRKRQGARLGQHFLTGQWAAHALAEAIAPAHGETILEIGPGKGVLTRELLAVGEHVIAVEKDPVLVKILQNEFSGDIAAGKLILIEGDIRDFSSERANLKAGEYVLAANIPYYITGEIIRQFLTTVAQPRAIGLLIQKEVADRIIARDGKESILSLSVKAYGAPKIVAKVSRGNFSPPPSVDSAIILISEISKKYFSDITEDLFFKVVKAGFASKRKFLANNLAHQFPKETAMHALVDCGLSANVRAEDVSLEKWKMLTRQLTS